MARKAADGGRRRLGPRLAAWAAVTAAVLLVPLVAMRFTSEVTWTASDFAFAGGLVFGVGAVYELATWRADGLAYKAAVGVGLAAVFLLVWLSGAVGVIGSEDNPANLMFAGVLAVGIVGAFVARFRPDGMARTLVATALAQALVLVIAVSAGLAPLLEPAGWPRDPVLTGFFTGLWLLSAGLFHAAARGRGPAL